MYNSSRFLLVVREAEMPSRPR